MLLAEPPGSTVLIGAPTTGRVKTLSNCRVSRVNSWGLPSCMKERMRGSLISRARATQDRHSRTSRRSQVRESPRSRVTAWATRRRRCTLSASFADRGRPDLVEAWPWIMGRAQAKRDPSMAQSGKSRGGALHSAG